MVSGHGTKGFSIAPPSTSAKGLTSTAKRAGQNSMKAPLPTARNRCAENVRYMVHPESAGLCDKQQGLAPRGLAALSGALNVPTTHREAGSFMSHTQLPVFT